MQDITLIVLQHGLWGKHEHLAYIEKSLKDKLKDKPVEVLNSNVNEGKYTYDGIDLCGERLAKKICSYVDELRKEGKRVQKLCMVGYSLGGLIARYTIGLLDENCFFNDIQPGFFVTFATPHIGVRRPKTSLFSKLFNFFSGRMVSRTGEQLQLIDRYENDLPLLSILASPDRPYYQALAKFDTIRTYANIKNDRTVPYWTAALMKTKYFSQLEKLELAIDQEYPAIVIGYDVADESKKKKRRLSKQRFSSILRKALFYTLAPLLFPLFIVLAFLYIGIQGVISRIRVAKLLKSSLPPFKITTGSTSPTVTTPRRASLSSLSSSDTTVDHDHQPSTAILSGALDAFNVTADDQGNCEHTSTHPLGAWCNVVPSGALQKQATEYVFDTCVLETQRNLSQLPWQTVLVCLHSFNAHGGIVCRQNIHTTAESKAVIKHFLDTTPM